MTGLEKIRFISHNEAMKNTSVPTSFLTSVLALIIFTSATATAEKIKVRKVKGNSAVIETITPLEEGQTYDLAVEPVSQDVDYKQGVLKQRENSVTFGVSYEYIKSDLLQRSSLDLQVRYGWNFGSIEAGVLAGATSLDQGAGATTSYMGGGYFDYDLVPNREPNKVIYGPFVLAAVGSTQYPSSATGGSSSLLKVNTGGFLTYFFGNSTTAARVEGFYDYQQINTSSVQNSVAGFGLRGLLVYYF